MQEGLVFWIISSFFITTALTEGNVLEFRSKRFFDNFDYINTTLEGGTPEIEHEKEPERYIQYTYCNIGTLDYLDTFQDFLIAEHMKLRILEISISSLNHVNVRTTKTPKLTDNEKIF